MPSSHDLTARETRNFEEICRKRGLRVTFQRLEIFKALTRRKDHPSAEDIYEAVKPGLPMISFDTVYRTLDLFAQCGLVRKVHHAGHKNRYDPDVSSHHHLVCTRCKRIEDFKWEEADALSLPKKVRKWGRVEGKTVEVWGLCRKCLAEDDGK